jgi:D-3-phosphoglycerate dehydrogenase/(S)-sulfolactate dehydrogenase
MKVLVADELSPQGIEMLRKAAGLTVDVKIGLKPPELKAIVGDYQALAVRSATKVTAELLEAARGLKVIGRAGVGVDNIDVDAATKKNVIVMNTPGGNSMAVAELTLAMLLALPRQLVQAATSTKAGKWEKKRFAAGHELFQKTVGILGLGNIGSLVAQRCLAFGTTVLVYDPHPSEAARKLGMSVQFVSLEECVRRADFLTIHVPANEKTKNLVGAALFAQMKKGTYLVNCARGGIVDEVALARALQDGTLAGAAMDVFATEPVAPDHPLLKLENFIATPHLGASTEEGQLACANQLAEQLVEFLQRGVVRNAVNSPAARV